MAVLLALPHGIWVVARGFPTVSYVFERGRSGDGALGHILHPLDFLGRQLLALEFLLVALVVLLAWPLRVRALEASERFTRQYLLAITLGPGLALLLVSAATGMQLRAAWGMPLWSALGMLLLFCFETRPRGTMLKRAALACVLFGIVNIAFALIEGVWGPYLTSRGFRTHFPGQLLAARVVEIWDKRFDVPLRLVAGERWLAGNVAFYAPSRPSVLTNGGLGGCSPDEAECPWTSIADFKNRGGVLVWSVDREGAALPPDFEGTFPRRRDIAHVDLPWQTGAPVKPVNIGIAVVAPRSPIASR